MVEKRKKRKRKSKSSGAPSPGGGGAPGGGGVMQSIRSGFRRAAGAEESKESSRLGNIVWTIILIAAIAFFLYRQYG